MSTVGYSVQRNTFRTDSLSSDAQISATGDAVSGTIDDNAYTTPMQDPAWTAAGSPVGIEWATV